MTLCSSCMYSSYCLLLFSRLILLTAPYYSMEKWMGTLLLWRSLCLKRQVLHRLLLIKSKVRLHCKPRMHTPGLATSPGVSRLANYKYVHRVRQCTLLEDFRFRKLILLLGDCLACKVRHQEQFLLPFKRDWESLQIKSLVPWNSSECQDTSRSHFQVVLIFSIESSQRRQNQGCTMDHSWLGLWAVYKHQQR